MNIKAVFFDYGQVICHPQDPATIDRIAELAGVERKKFEPVLWALRDDYDLGRITAKEYYIKILSSLGAGIDVKKIDAMIETDLASWKSINNGTVALMEEIKKAGYTLGILSNMPEDFLAWARKTLPVFSLPHIGIFSCEVSHVKPDKAIYEEMLSALNTKSNEPAFNQTAFSEIVFFDDKEENVKSARDLGIDAFLWKDPENARQELLSLGLKL